MTCTVLLKITDFEIYNNCHNVKRLEILAVNSYIIITSFVISLYSIENTDFSIYFVHFS